MTCVVNCVMHTYVVINNYKKHYKKVSEYDQEISQSQTADNPMAPWGRATKPTRDTRKKKISKAASSLFPIKMIAILEWT